AAHDLADPVPPERHILDGRPRRRAVLIARGEEHGPALLLRFPGVFEDVPFDQHAARVLELQQVLDDPARPLPGQWLANVVPADLNIGGDESWDAGVPAAEHDVLA